MSRFEALERFGRRASIIGDGVADAGIADLFDRGIEIADLARPQAVDGFLLGPEHADAIDGIGPAGTHQADLHAFFERALDDPHQADDAEIAVIPAIDQHRLERRIRIAMDRGRQALHDGFEHVLNAETGLCGNLDGFRGINTDHILDLRLDPIDIGSRQIDLVEHRDDLVIDVNRLIDIRQRLRLNTLGGVNDQKRAFAGSQ